jgi:hypothetical protein
MAYNATLLDWGVSDNILEDLAACMFVTVQEYFAKIVSIIGTVLST